MAFKAINNTTGFNSLILTLLVFGAYPRIVTDSPFSFLQQQQANALVKAMFELRK